MKVSTSSEKELIAKIRKLEDNLIQQKKEKSELREKNRAQSKRISSLVLSRDKWKQKNKAKTFKNKSLQRRLQRRDRPGRHHYGIDLVYLCIALRIVCGCSYRGICKILKVLQLSFSLDWASLPCANTIENWVSKMGLYALESATERLDSKKVCLIMDETLKLSNERVLLIIITPVEKAKQGALTQSDVQLCYLAGKTTWTGQSILDQLQTLVNDKAIQVDYILSDEDSKLLKATRLLGVAHVPDIHHAVGNCLRKLFKKNEAYQALIQLCSSYAAKCVNQDLTYLRPPKQRVKARFMNQKGIIKWALIMLENFEQLNEKEQNFFGGLKAHRPIIQALDQCIELSEQISKLLKENGLSQSTLQVAKTKLARSQNMHKGMQIQEDFIILLNKYVHRYEDFLTHRSGCYPVSSDVIESLFGKYKTFSGSNPLVGVSMVDLQLPVNCMEPKQIKASVKTALEAIFTTDLRTWIKEHSIENQSIKRNKFFKNRA